MALDITVGGSSTDSYVTLSEADSYIEDKGYTTTTWDALDDEPKELRLTTSALLINTLPLRGAKACRNQRLEFPRWWRTNNGYPPYENTYEEYLDIISAGYAQPIVPVEVKYAQIEIAYHVVHYGILAMDSMAYPEREIKAFGLGGSLSIEFTDLPIKSYSSFSKAKLSSLDIVYTLLHKWIRRVSGGVV